MFNGPSNSIFDFPRILLVSRLHATCINAHIRSLHDILPFLHFIEGITVVFIRIRCLVGPALLQTGESVVEGMQGRKAANDDAER